MSTSSKYKNTVKISKKKNKNPPSCCCRQEHHAVLFRNMSSSILSMTYSFIPTSLNRKVALKPCCFDVLKPLTNPDYMVTCHQGCDGLYISCGQFIFECILYKYHHTLITPSSGFFCHLLCQL